MTVAAGTGAAHFTAPMATIVLQAHGAAWLNGSSIIHTDITRIIITRAMPYVIVGFTPA